MQMSELWYYLAYISCFLLCIGQKLLYFCPPTRRSKTIIILDDKEKFKIIPAKTIFKILGLHDLDAVLYSSLKIIHARNQATFPMKFFMVDPYINYFPEILSDHTLLYL